MIGSTVAGALGLPGRVLSCDQVGGAWSNRLFRVVTSGGAFAVKELLNPWDDPRWLDWLREAARFEEACIVAGVTSPAIHRNVQGNVFTHAAGRWFRVHEWIAAGSPCPPGAVTIDVARQVGRDLAVAHGLEWSPARTDIFPVPSGDEAHHWPALVRSLQVTPEWAEIAASISRPVAQIAAWIDEPRAPARAIMSHGDLDPKNLVLTRKTWIVDWDVAMPWRPADEVVRSALSLADWSNPRIAGEFVTAYEEHSGTNLDFDHTCLTTDLTIGLDWLARCLRRASGVEPSSAVRRAEAREQVRSQAASLPERVTIADNIRDWLQR